MKKCSQQSNNKGFYSGRYQKRSLHPSKLGGLPTANYDIVE